MGNKMISETLEQGFVDSKPSQTEKPCNKIPEEMDSVSVCHLSSKCMTDVVNNGHPDVNDGKLAGKLSKWSSRESMACNGIIAGNSEFNKGCSSDNLTDPKTSVLANHDERINKDVPNLGGDSKLYGNVGFEIGKFEECVKKSDDVSFSPEPSSPTEIEFSGEGINLFVEVFGPLDGISEDNRNLKEEVEDHLLDKNGNIKNSIFKNEGEKEVGDRTFDVGDLVWVKTQTPLWWPGIIFDPSSNKTKSEKKGAFLVKYFGHANLIWCNNLDLKPFIEHYEQLSRQNTSRSFCGSVEKALSEIGRRVKSKMTCPCFSKENLTLLDTKDNTDDVLSLSRFDTASLLACVRNFASSACSPSKIELTVVKNRLSSFYHSIGHHDLPMQVLYGRNGSLYEVRVEGCSYLSGGRESLRAKKKKNPSDYDDLASTDKPSPSNKGSESRERKRSKFLSYPFVNDGSEEQGNEDQKHGLNSMKKGSKKSVKVHHVVSKADDIDAPSSELLAELRSVVGDPFSIEGSKYPDSLKRFYFSFRSYAFLDADIAAKEAWAKQETKGEKNHPKNSCKEAKGQKKEVKVVKKGSENSSSNLDSINKLAKMDIPGAQGSVSCMSSEKMGRQVMSAGLELKNPLAIGINACHDGSRMISFVQTCPDVCEGKVAPNKKNEPHCPRPPSGNPISRLPDLNKNSPVPVESRIPNINNMGQSAFASVIPSEDAVGLTPTQNVLRFASDVINAASRCHIRGSALGQAGSAAINTGPGPFARQPPQMNFSPQMDLGKGKEIKVSQFLNWVAPDLEGESPGSDPLGQTASPTGLNVSLSDGKQQQKRARKEDPGGSLVLKFSQSSVVPTLETLFTKLSRYGLVKVAEIRALNETTIEIPYERTPDVCFAHRSLESGHSFGPALVGFELNCPHVKVEKKLRKSQVLTIGPPPKMPARPALVTPRMPARPALWTHRMPVRPAVEVPKAPAGLGAPPDITFMKQNVKMMKATLEEMGDKIPPDARARLHNEIQAFLGKIGNMTGDSSSS